MAVRVQNIENLRVSDQLQQLRALLAGVNDYPDVADGDDVTVRLIFTEHDALDLHIFFGWLAPP
jgi:hypothetical protein